MTEPVLPPPPPAQQRLKTRLRAHPGAILGGGLLAVIFALVWLGPLVWPLAPDFIDTSVRNQGPSPAHPLGTDHLGRDLLARLMAGGRTSLSVGLAAMALAVGLGALIGVTAGYFRRLDGPLMRLTDLFLSLPILPLVLVMSMLFSQSLRSRFGAETGLFILVVLAIGLTSWMPTARILRSEVLRLKNLDFITAARAGGSSDWRLITRHILPNTVSPIVVSAALGMANAIITESALSFLGLGFPPDFPSWGRQLFDGTAYLQDYPARVIWPGLAISLTVLGVNYLGDGLRDALDPRRMGATAPNRK